MTGRTNMLLHAYSGFLKQKNNDAKVEDVTLSIENSGKFWFTIIFILYWDFLIFYPIFLSPQVKWCAIVNDQDGMFVWPYKSLKTFHFRRFHMKTRASLKYPLNDCRARSPAASNLHPQLRTPSPKRDTSQAQRWDPAAIPQPITKCPRSGEIGREE